MINGYRVFFGDDENILKQIEAMVEKHYEYAKCH